MPNTPQSDPSANCYSRPDTTTIHESYGLRRWDAVYGKWIYWSSVYKGPKKGHVMVWKAGSDQAWTSTSLLSTLFSAEAEARKKGVTDVVEVVMFLPEVPVHVAHHTHRPLELGEFPEGHKGWRPKLSPVTVAEQKKAEAKAWRASKKLKP